jgi:hypothetical protein
MVCPRYASAMVTKVEPPSSAASASAVARVGGASRDALVRRSRVAPCRTTSWPWRSAGPGAIASGRPKSVSGWPSAESWSIRARSTAGYSPSCRCSVSGLDDTASPWVPTGESMRRTLASVDAGITSTGPSLGVARSSMPTCRRRATEVPPAGSSSGRSIPADDTASCHPRQSRQLPARQRWPQRCPVCCIEPGATAPTASSVILAS